MGTKTCTHCQEVLPFSMFSADRRLKSGLRACCKLCDRVQRKRYVATTKGRAAHNRGKKKYYKNNPGLMKEFTRRWRHANREKVRAHKAMGRAIKTGKIVKMPCAVCGDASSIGHHEDYSKPLEVTWLCRLHHAWLHWGKKEGNH